MIHRYKYNGKNIVLDVNSGAVHIFDELSWDIMEAVENPPSTSNDSLVKLLEKYHENEVLEALNEINQLKKEKILFSEDIFEGSNIKRPVVKALCLHIAHDCNLKCKYCFAGEGEYHGKRSMMSVDTGKRALGFLIANSGNRMNLEVDFFGGEPTINFDAIKKIVEYGKSLEKMYNKRFRFTLTSNAVFITDEMIDFCNENMSNVVLSIDGRQEVNDRMRPDRNGHGSYEKIVPNIKRFVEKRGGRDYYVRGTFTRYNLDFAKDVLHLYELGFNHISLEPVVAPKEAEYSIREADLPALFCEYDQLTKIISENNDLSFFHFNIDLSGGSCAAKRISGCGAGCEYLSVTPDGSLYPCHQFAGLNDFKLGTVYEGITNKRIVDEFSGLNVYKKESCRDCWAKFYCSGGCAANSYQYGGSVTAQYEIGCLLQKKRIECAIYLQTLKD